MEVRYKRSDKSMHLAEYIYTKYLINPILPVLGKSFITPNMVTLLNSFWGLYIFYLAYLQKFFWVGIGIQLYLFFDILDGNLARYKNMRSDLGKKLDEVNDALFYTFIFVFIGFGTVPLHYIAGVIFLMNAYGLLAKYYIVPRLKKLERIRRDVIKKFFLDRGVIIGMDIGTVDIVITIFLIWGHIPEMYEVIMIGLLTDIFFRIKELRKNEAIQLKMSREGG